MQLTYDQIETIFDEMEDGQLVDIKTKDPNDIGRAKVSIQTIDGDDITTFHLEMYGNKITESEANE